MKLTRSLFIAAVSLVASSAKAEWTFVSNGVDGSETYVELSTKKIINGLRRIWIRQELSTASIFHGKPYLSSRMLDEFDCSQDRYRIVFADLFVEKSLGGESFQVPNAFVGDWQYIAPGTVFESVEPLVCR